MKENYLQRAKNRKKNWKKVTKMMNYVDFLYNWVENLDYSLKKLKSKHTE